jgi:hypothetical protein
MKFIESKYHYALDTTFKQTGVISFTNDYIEIKYVEQSKILRYSGNTLLTKYKGKKEVLNLDTNPPVKLFFLLVDAIYFEKKNILASYFIAHKEKDYIHLTPNDKISSFIEQVTYRKEKNKLIYMKIFLINKDRIKIEEVD